MFTDFPISFTGGLSSKFAIKDCLKLPPCLNRVATLPCEISMFKNRRAQWVSTAECRVRLHHSKIVSKYLSEEISRLLFPNRKKFTSAVSKIAWHTVHSFCDKEYDEAAKCRAWSAVTDGVSLLVSMSKLVCIILISVDNKVKWICLLTKQINSSSFCPSYTSYSTQAYVASSAYMRKKAQGECSA